jgi:arginyl-tRNA synthetase
MGRSWAKRCEHIPFGLVTIGGEKGSSKGGNVVLLKNVIAEAETRVRALIAADADRVVTDAMIRDVAVGAVVFANLASQRDKDVAFEWDRVIALQGDSGPYLQYSHARCASIIRKAAEQVSADADVTKLSTAAEWAVARKLLEYPGAVVAATPKCEPHIICHYLLELAGEFSRWYTAGNGDPTLRVLVDDQATRAARLALVAAVQATLAQGLSLLGLAAPDQM